MADFATPPDCAVDPCGTISGTITDSVSGAPLEGVTVGIGGHVSVLGGDLGAKTDAAGTFTISDVPFHTYSKFVVDQVGYEPATISNLAVNGDETVERKITRDWAATEGGAVVGHFTPPTTPTSVVGRRARSTTRSERGGAPTRPGRDRSS